ncbi:MAG TPA: HEPN domain-containing protein [Phycisphaerae bacterium]|nr:HEPN domain-containing protein [Phycisphaerae bacterium]
MVPRSIEARRYYFVAQQRLEDAKLLFERVRYGSAVYLAGYSVECILKAILLEHSPRRRQSALLVAFRRGGRGHDFEWLIDALPHSGRGSFPRPISRDVRIVSTWSVDLRYNAGAVKREDAREFIAAVERLVTFFDARIG